MCFLTDAEPKKLLKISVKLQIFGFSGQEDNMKGHTTATSPRDKFQILSMNPLALYNKNENHFMYFLDFFFLSPFIKVLIPWKAKEPQITATQNICKC